MRQELGGFIMIADDIGWHVMAFDGKEEGMNTINEKWSFQVRPSMSLFSVSQPKFHPNFHTQKRSEEKFSENCFMCSIFLLSLQIEAPISICVMCIIKLECSLNKINKACKSPCESPHKRSLIQKIDFLMETL